MYPTITLFGVTIYTFGTIIACTWFLFFILLHRFAWKKWFTKPIFSSIVSFTLVMFFSARIFFIFSEWVEQKFILMDLINGNILEFFRLFFIPKEYLFSLFGAIIGFIVVFLIKTHKEKKNRLRYLDAITYAFLFSAILGYAWALLGGQVYGIPFSSPISLVYNHQDSIITERSALFPLPILYMILALWVLFSIDRLSKKTALPDGFIGFLGIWLFFTGLFLGEFLSGSRKDMFYDVFYLSLNQIGALILIIISILGIWKLTHKHL